MGSVYQAYCGCGFQADVSIGGSRRGFLEHSSFPFFCNDCGLVSVNVAKLPRGQTVTECPNCRAAGCTQYGIPPVSLHDLRPLPWWRRWLQARKTDPVPPHVLQWGEREASEADHLCPNCRQMTLRFSWFPTVMFD